MKKTYRLLRYRLTSLFISFNIVILYIVAVLRGAAQPNLIPNPDFEEVYEFCYEPINNPGWYFTTSFLLLKNWLPTLYSVLYDGNGNVVLVYANLYTLSNYGTPDLYHSCILLSAFRPFEPNTAGYQLPYSGQGYIGMGIDAIWNRETVRVKLLDTLKKGQGYCFSFHYSLANYSSAAASHLGAVFSRDSFYVGTIPQDIDYDTRVFSDSVLCKDLDTVNWHIYEGHFLAKGGEEWLTLGWLHKTQHISFVFAPYPVGDTLDYFKAYYLIDALELIECPQYGVPDYEVIPPNVISPN
ncbi:MAG: hypothetical protein H3C71_08830, partial [Flavobacteriales bacterium]|nr:hypothetical protein [Flavobacteriales bacterium]